MNNEGYYRDLGYQQGLADGKRTGGKIKKKYIENLFRSETQYLSNQESQVYKMGWQEGFTDAVRDAIQSMVLKENCFKKHLDKVYGVGC
ncbi:hypothetical protein ACFLYW_01895 [Thermodesulfobacteriota bacterium]